MVGGAKLLLESNPVLARDGPRAYQDPETEPELCLSVSCGFTGQQWPVTRATALGAVDLGMA